MRVRDGTPGPGYRRLVSTTVPEPPQQPHAAAAPANKRRPWVWIVACTLLLVAAVALGIWALSLQGDLNDQKDKTAAAQSQAKSAQDDAQAAQDDLQSVSDQVDQLTKSLSDAGDQLAQGTAEAKKNAQDAIAGMQDSIDSMRDRAKTALDKLKAAAAQR
jgi:peptidoglycan hydrolase CwlO-like protein